MEKLRDTLPTTEALRARSKEVVRVAYAAFTLKTAPERALVKRWQKAVGLAISFTFGLALCLKFLFGFSDAWSILLMVPFLVWSTYAVKHLTDAYLKLTVTVNTELVVILSQLLDRPIRHESKEKHETETKALFAASELLTEDMDTVLVDDTYYTELPLPLSVREIKVTKTTGSGKNRDTRTLFHGVLAVATLPKTLSGVTFVSTEGDKSGFGHQNFWTRVLSLGVVKETTLEWNEFERDLHVATTNESEARYVLTPNFMLDLHTWWREHQQNVRLVFRDNRLFIALPDSKVRFLYSTFSSKPEAISEYVYTVALPLWRILKLVEDVRL